MGKLWKSIGVAGLIAGMSMVAHGATLVSASVNLALAGR
jgi:hypothetical protein